MTDINYNMPRETSGFARFGQHISALASGVMQGLAAYSDRRSRIAQISALESRTDAELSAMGLRREDIARHVFRDLFFA